MCKVDLCVEVDKVEVGFRAAVEQHVQQLLEMGLRLLGTQMCDSESWMEGLSQSNQGQIFDFSAVPFFFFFKAVLVEEL